MIRLEVSQHALEDLQRIAAHLVAHEAEDVAGRLRAIQRSLAVLQVSPEIGRPASRGFRELIIGRGARGYVALYRYEPEEASVTIVALRGQREAGYR